MSRIDPFLDNTSKLLAGVSYLLSGSKPIVVRWPDRGPVRHNWGDKLNPYLVGRLSGRQVINASRLPRSLPVEIHSVIGSALGTAKGSNVVVFGTGFIRQDAQLDPAITQVTAVRGPLTADKLRSRFGALPIGDAALLMPLLYAGHSRKTHRIGVIPHFREQQLPIFQGNTDPSVRWINVMGGIEEFVDDVLSCEVIVTSSLHGAILAHAYGVPATIVSVSNIPLGDGSKFLDYLHSVGLGDSLRRCETWDDLLAAADHAAAPRELPSIARLLEVCPFIRPDLRKSLLARVPEVYRWAGQPPNPLPNATAVV